MIIYIKINNYFYDSFKSFFSYLLFNGNNQSNFMFSDKYIIFDLLKFKMCFE